MKKGKSNQKGFTIIESIIALVMVSFMAAMLYSFSQPLYSSAGAYGLFNDELILQQGMERILADYKSQRNDGNNPFDPSVFRQYVIQHPQYSTMVDAGRTGFLSFTSAGMTYTATWPPQATIPAGAPAVLIVTLQRNGRFLSMIFT
jgi:prepilin-type N-terminal cleavage/methylation domain-containing protein